MINFTEELKDAMKSHDELKKAVLRNIKSARLNFESQKGRPVYDDLAEVRILRKMINEIESAIPALEKAGGKNLIEEYKAQIKLLESYIPESPSEDKIKEEVKKYLEGTDFSYPYPKNLIKVCMDYVYGIYPSADGRLLSKIVRELCGGV